MKKDISQPEDTTQLLKNKIKKYIGKKSSCNITSGKTIELCGCCGLVTYKDELMEIILCDSFIRINGSNLRLKHYYGGRMIICGIILSVEYIFEKDVRL